ncbi:hypothetical protein [Sphingobacterium sp. MYb382]|uniref:hypothetical protein n=1 Tax=Sphingobacterium sp. MYb382 TaxID=2745278 RepID=UPI00309BCA79
MRKLTLKSVESSTVLSRSELKNVMGGNNGEFQDFHCTGADGTSYTCTARSASECFEVAAEHNIDLFGCS